MDGDVGHGVSFLRFPAGNQFSIDKLSMRSKCRTLRVTTISPCTRAVAAMNRSAQSRLRPLRRNWAVKSAVTMHTSASMGNQVQRGNTSLTMRCHMGLPSGSKAAP